jgi:hypothetical protein
MSLPQAVILTIFLIIIGIWLMHLMLGHYKESKLTNAITALLLQGYCVIYKNKHIQRTSAGYFVIYFFSKRGDFEQEEVYTDIQNATNRFVDLVKVKDVPVID